MTAMAHEPLSQADVLLEGFLALETPEGFRAELIEGEIVVTPPPDGDHEDCIGLIVTQVIRGSRTDMQFSGNKGLKLKSGGACPKNHAIPDGTFAPFQLQVLEIADGKVQHVVAFQGGKFFDKFGLPDSLPADHTVG